MFRTCRDKKNERGFTLIELLIVIVIISILAGLGAANYIQTRKRGNDGKRAADLNNLRNALEMYYADNHAYPDATGVWEGASSLDTALVSGSEVYTRQIPSDPTGDYAYRYYGYGNGSCYCLSAQVEVSSNVQNMGDCGTTHSEDDYDYYLTCP